MSEDYNHELRVRALALPETDLRRAVDRLLEQCGKEEAYPAPSDPRSGMLYASEIYQLLGLRQGPGYGALREAIEKDAGGKYICAHCGRPIEPTGSGHDWIGPVPEPGKPQKRYHLSPDFPDCRRASGACGTGGGDDR